MNGKLLLSTVLLASFLNACDGGGGGGDDDNGNPITNAGNNTNPTNPGTTPTPGIGGPSLGPTPTPNTIPGTNPGLNPGAGPAAGVNLLGLWVRCDGVNEINGYIRGLKSELEITNETSARLTYFGYKDGNCAQAFTQTDANSLLQEIQASGVTGDEFAQWQGLLFGLSDGIPNQMQYRATPMNAQGIGSMDEQDPNGVQTFTSYKIVGRQLYIAPTCTQVQLQNQECNQLAGESSRNRATDFSNALPYTWGHD